MVPHLRRNISSSDSVNSPIQWERVSCVAALTKVASIEVSIVLRSVHTRRHVAATNRFVCSGEFCENLCRSNRILSPQQVAQIQSDLIFCDLLQRQNSVAGTKIFTKILHTWGDLSPRRVAATCRLVCTDLYRYLSCLVYLLAGKIFVVDLRANPNQFTWVQIQNGLVFLRGWKHCFEW